MIDTVTRNKQEVGAWRLLTLIGIVSLDVSDMMPGELVNSLLDFGQTAILPHPQSGEVGVSTGAVPVSLSRERKKRRSVNVVRINFVIIHISRHIRIFFFYLHGLGVHWDDDTEVLGDPVEEESGHPEIISHLDTFAWADLEFPLESEY